MCSNARCQWFPDRTNCSFYKIKAVRITTNKPNFKNEFLNNSCDIQKGQKIILGVKCAQMCRNLQLFLGLIFIPWLIAFSIDSTKLIYLHLVKFKQNSSKTQLNIDKL